MPGDYAAPCWLLRQARQLLYPRRCPFCRRVLGFVPTCPECAERLEPLHRMPMRLRESEHYLGTLSGAALRTMMTNVQANSSPVERVILAR